MVVSVLILEKGERSPLFVDIGGLRPEDVLSLAEDLNRHYDLIGVVEGRWQRELDGLSDLFPLVTVVRPQLKKYMKAPHNLKLALMVTWEKELAVLDRLDSPWAKFLRPKLEKLRASLLSNVKKPWTRFDLIE